MITWVLFLGIGLVVGVVAGMYFARLDDFSNSRKKMLQQKLDLAEQQLNAYKSQVSEHFVKTASLVNSLTESYKAVHEHLAEGARDLCDSDVTVPQLEMLATKSLDKAALPLQEDSAQDNTTQEKIEAEKSDSVVAPTGMQASEAVPNTDNSPTDEPIEKTVEEQSTASTELEDSAQAQQKETAAVPPSTPESLHVVEGDSTPAASLKDAEHSTSASTSRTVH